MNYSFGVKEERRTWVRHPRGRKILLYTETIIKMEKFCKEAGLSLADVKFIFDPEHLEDFLSPITLYVYGSEVLRNDFEYEKITQRVMAGGGQVVYLSEVP